VGLEAHRPGGGKMRSAETGSPRGVHEQFLLGGERAQKLQKPCFFGAVETIALGEFADAPDLAETCLLDLLQIDPLAHLNPRNATFWQ